ncbi:hypothetical protein BSL78_13236 [Apostichopus japonicus]|uniref:Uncharacterized protein n=1 Tax=Stichopus japonicus TaxID=307972 RepID=A0A2G8KPH8_STIJA|nr:hypothetical protein BSL78_13236 [Apostichopus japonicus]
MWNLAHGKVLEERADAFKIRWANYRVTIGFAKEKTRLPVPKRHVGGSENWKNPTDFYQKGEEVTIEGGRNFWRGCKVEENDPFNCCNDCKPGRGLNNRSSTVSSGCRQPPKGPRKRNPASGPAQLREHVKQGAVDDEEDKDAGAQKDCNEDSHWASSPRDDGGPPQAEGMAYGCADAATMAIQSVVSSATAEGNPLPLPDEWSRATPAFGCSAVCDGRFAELTCRFSAVRKLAELRKRVDEMERKQGSIQQAPTSSPMPVPATPPPIELSSAVGNALLTLSSSPAPAPTPLQEQDSPIHVLLA